jgi:hypothetical protein
MCLRHGHFGAGIPRVGLTFLLRQESKQRRRPLKHEIPSLRIIEAASIQLASLKHELTTTPPRLFLTRRVFRGFLAQYNDQLTEKEQLCANEKEVFHHDTRHHPHNKKTLRFLLPHSNHAMLDQNHAAF